MSIWKPALILASLMVSPVAMADDAPKLRLPLACTPGEDCWIARYVDHAPGPDATDYRCRDHTQDKHKGTDFMLANLGRMTAGVDVLAAADGKVARVRDGEEDRSMREKDRGDVDGKECGNAVFIQHGNGWATQYCHLKQGSLTVKPGMTVKAGDKIAEVGLSGMTEYPHLHLTVWHKDQAVDPFDSGTFETTCSGGPGSLWRDGPNLAYAPIVLLPPTLTRAPLDWSEVWDAPAPMIQSGAPSIILTARAFHAEEGDIWTFTILDPDGNVFLEKSETQGKDKQFQYRFMGRKAPARGLKTGDWKGIVTISRPLPGGGATEARMETTLKVIP